MFSIKIFSQKLLLENKSKINHFISKIYLLNDLKNLIIFKSQSNFYEKTPSNHIIQKLMRKSTAAILC